MKKEKFTFMSSSGVCNISAVRYIPDKPVKAILQIAHGMVEYIDRYDKFATFLCENGILVTGNDHLGHGDSVLSKEDWGYFCEKEGYLRVLDDMHILTTLTKKEYPDVPYFLLGHSMGSFFARLYLIKFGQELNGCIVMGTGQQSPATIQAGKVLCKMIAANKGWHHRSKTVNATAIGSYNKKWEPSQTHCDWLTKDNSIVEAYSKEPRNQFVFTLNGFYNLFSCIGEIIKKENLVKMPKQVPVLITSGADDPVGEFSKAPKIVYQVFKDVGMQDVEIKLYDNDRHEILNETDNEVVYQDLYNWINKKITLR